MKKKAPTPRNHQAGPDHDTVLRARRIFRTLTREYPDAHCELDFRNPFELLVATILSAQCTDVRVNKVTPELFARYPTPAALGRADQADIEDLVRTTGFFRNKAKSLISASRDIAERHGNEVPATMEELLRLRGVARKTANVVLGNAFDTNDGVVVDTHVNRLTNRMGLTEHQNPEKIERELMGLLPRKQWCLLSHLLISHGRRVCNARRPDCGSCALKKECHRIGVTSTKTG